MNEQAQSVMLLKIGQEKDMIEFQGGVLYMNTLEHFQNIENCQVRGDKDEGLSAILQAKGGKLLRENDKGEFVPVGTITDIVRYREKNSAHKNVFCMYALQVEPKKQSIGKRIMDFGDSYVQLSDPNEFLKRVKRTAARNNIELYHKLVEYVNRDTYSGQMGPWKKFNEFSYQNEFRIVAITKSNGPYELNIGDISDITTLGKLS